MGDIYLNKLRDYVVGIVYDYTSGSFFFVWEMLAPIASKLDYCFDEGQFAQTNSGSAYEWMLFFSVMELFFGSKTIPSIGYSLCKIWKTPLQKGQSLWFLNV